MLCLVSAQGRVLWRVLGITLPLLYSDWQRNGLLERR